MRACESLPEMPVRRMRFCPPKTGIGEEVPPSRVAMMVGYTCSTFSPSVTAIVAVTSVVPSGCPSIVTSS